MPAENVSSKTDGRSVRLVGTGVVYCRKQWVERSGWLVGSMQGIWGLFENVVAWIVKWMGLNHVWESKIY